MAAAVMTRAIFTGLAASVFAATVMAAEPDALPGVVALPLTATMVRLDPADPARRDVGRLRYRGGLVLRSTNGAFGGVSALRAGPGGRLLGITDTGAWVSFGIVERGGQLVGVTDGVMAPLRDETGRTTRSKSDFDAEGLEWNPATGEVLVSLEQDHRVLTYAGVDPARPETLDRPAVRAERNPATANWGSNSGGEAIATLTGGDRLIFEEGEQDRVTLDVLRIGPGGTRVLRYTPPAGYRPTDAVEVSPDLLLVLNRRFTISEGVSAAVTLVPVADAMQGEEIGRLTPAMTVDNMEGMALVRQAGRTFIYLISDDNFKAVERTLLLKFEVLPTPSPIVPAKTGTQLRNKHRVTTSEGNSVPAFAGMTIRIS